MTNAAAGRKERSHERILAVASRIFRERGGDGVHVDEVMGEAGLTRGGFYAHFADKTALLVEALDEAFVEARRNLLGKDRTLRGRAWLERAARVYLSRKHVDAHGEGCAVPPLAGEVARGEPALKRAFTENLERMLDGMTEHLEGDRSKAIATLATFVGALSLARAVDDRALADAILREAARAVLGGEDPARR